MGNGFGILDRWKWGNKGSLWQGISVNYVKNNFNEIIFLFL